MTDEMSGPRDEGATAPSGRAARLDELSDRVAQMIAEAGFSLDELLDALEDEREQYYIKRNASRE